MRSLFAVSAWCCFALGVADVGALNLYWMPQLSATQPLSSSQTAAAFAGADMTVPSQLQQDSSVPPNESATKTLVIASAPAQLHQTTDASTPSQAATNVIILFATGRAVVSTEDNQRLAVLATQLRQHSQKIVIEGHTDARGEKHQNHLLGELRARMVANILRRHGVAAQHISVVSYGEDMPMTPGTENSAAAQNRRVEVKIQSLFR